MRPLREYDIQTAEDIQDALKDLFLPIHLYFQRLPFCIHIFPSSYTSTSKDSPSEKSPLVHSHCSDSSIFPFSLTVGTL